MFIVKHIEAIFVVALGLFASVALFDAPPATPARIEAAGAAPADIPVVTVTAKRMTAQEKAASLREEQTVTASHAQARSTL